MVYVLIILAATLVAILFFNRKDHQLLKQMEGLFIDENLLAAEVKYFAHLSADDKKRFIENMKDFLGRVKITGVNVAVETLDTYLVAAGAVIPVFHFLGWKYYHLKEVLLYADAINENFDWKDAADKNILGMVGSGYMHGKMILSKPALRLGFSNKTDKANTVIHEFVHLVDSADGQTDGLPETVLNNQYILPWVDLMKKEMQLIYENKSDIDAYALVNDAEFLAVVASYFFERPHLLETHHPKIYNMMCKIFNEPEG